MANLYTKTGDAGQTSLVGGVRVSKASLRVECYGTIDEANSLLGLARTHLTDDFSVEAIRTIQEKLFTVGAELACEAADIKSLSSLVSPDDVLFLENVVDTCTQTTGKQTCFVIPGVDVGSATLHVARTVVRRAERRVVELVVADEVREVLVRYINRLSDAVYALARLREVQVEQAELRKAVTKIVSEKLVDRGVDSPLPTLEVLRSVAERAKEKSREIGVPIVFSAVDAGGNLVLLERMEGALLGSIEVAMGKAYTACAFCLPTHVLGEEGLPTGSLYGIENAAPGKIILFGGGFPYVVGDRVVGGIGVSGGTVEQDMEIARFAMGI